MNEEKKASHSVNAVFFFFETDNDDVDSSMRVLSKKKIIKEEIRKLPILRMNTTLLKTRMKQRISRIRDTDYSIVQIISKYS